MTSVEENYAQGFTGEADGSVGDATVDHVKVLLADDHAILLDGLKSILGPRYEILAAVTDGRAAVEETQKLRPQLALIDIAMPILNGIEATRRIRQETPETKVIILSMYSDRHYVCAAIRAGADGFVLKQTASAGLFSCIQRVLAGERFISPEIGLKIEDISASHDGSQAQFGSQLTPRQREVLQLVAEGKSAKDIAHLLKISVKTVEFHKASISTSLGLRTTAELTRYAIQQGMVA